MKHKSTIRFQTTLVLEESLSCRSGGLTVYVDPGSRCRNWPRVFDYSHMNQYQGKLKTVTRSKYFTPKVTSTQETDKKLNREV